MRSPIQNRLVQIWLLLPTGYKARSVLILFLTVIGACLEMLGLGIILPVMSLLIDPDYLMKADIPSQLTDTIATIDHTAMVLGGMVALFIVYVVKGFYLAGLAWEQARFAYAVKADISNALLRKYVYADYEFHLKANSSHLIRNISIEIEEFVAHSLVPAIRLIIELCVVIAIFTLLLIVNPLMTLFLTSIIGGFLLIFHLVTRNWLSTWGARRQLSDGQKLQRAQEALGAIKDAKLLGREEYFLEQHAMANKQSANMARNQLALSQLPYTSMEVVAVGALALLVIISILQGYEMTALMPVIGLFGAAAFRLIPSANRLLLAIQAIRFAAPVTELLTNELRTQAANPEAIASEIPFNRQIRLENLSFQFTETDERAITDISLSIGRGQTVGFVGTSGAGKSTIVNLILGLLKPSAGTIMVDDKNIADNLRGWQSKVGYVPQHIFLTDNTLRRNVAFGIADEGIDEAEVNRALGQAQLTDLVQNLPDGLDTMIGEQGVRLSGGQRQRIGIARALYSKPTVLVLDEASSALDAKTEEALVESINAMDSEITTIIVAHRMTTLKYCDQIFRLERGRLVERTG